MRKDKTMAEAKTPCADEFADVGALLLNARHEAERCLFYIREAHDGLMAVRKTAKERGIMIGDLGPAFVSLCAAEAVYGHLSSAHSTCAKALDGIGMAPPTDDVLVKKLTTLKALSPQGDLR
jgi:hypothetical protein